MVINLFSPGMIINISNRRNTLEQPHQCACFRLTASFILDIFLFPCKTREVTVDIHTTGIVFPKIIRNVFPLTHTAVTLRRQAVKAPNCNGISVWIHNRNHVNGYAFQSSLKLFTVILRHAKKHHWINRLPAMNPACHNDIIFSLSYLQHENIPAV